MKAAKYKYCEYGHARIPYIEECPRCEQDRHLTSPNGQEVSPNSEEALPNTEALRNPPPVVQGGVRGWAGEDSAPVAGGSRNARWRAAHKADYNAYMRDYMVAYRERKAT